MSGDGAAAASLPSRLAQRLARSPIGVTIELPGGERSSFGPGGEVVAVSVANERGLAALGSLAELRIVEAYLDGDIDLEGDLIAAMDLRKLLFDLQLARRTWALVEPRIRGRSRVDPGYVARHYDSANIQLLAIDDRYQVYTPGIYTDERDSLEDAAERKLEAAFASLGLRPGSSVLDVGCGWGGFAAYCARRGVEVTGLSLSRHQLDYARRRLADEGLEANLLYQDFFAYRPHRRFDAITLMGSIEELADYGRVMRSLAAWLAPGGRVYLDFASADRPFGISSFVTKYVWPGPFRLVYLPAFTRALARHHFDLVEVHNDRRNYYLWARNGYERWTARRAVALERADERTYRLIRLLMASTAHLMSPRSRWATAYRMVVAPREGAALESRTDRLARTAIRRLEALKARGAATPAAGSRP
jgi:cyclopropane-fatty-acyl-phospholipid synthase